MLQHLSDISSFFKELSGFYVYCSQIIAWLPPLIFTVIVEADVNQTYAVIVVTCFLVPAICMMMFFAAPWDEILKESGRSNEPQKDDTIEDGAIE